MRSLLAEDGAMIGEAVLGLLREGGCAVDWVKDGQMAETALMTGPCDLMRLDLGLPRKEGTGSAARIAPAS